MSIIFDASISYILQDNLAKYRSLFKLVCPKAKSYPRGTVLSHSGKSNNKMYFLLDGIIKIYTTNPKGYTRILGYHRQNTVFAMDCIVNNEAAVVSTESVTPVKVLEFSWDELSRIGEADSHFFPDLLTYYGKVLRLMCFDAESKSIGDISERLAGFLCLYESNMDENDGGKIALTQEDLASAVNASRVQIARICSDFKAKGYIKTFRGGITIANRDALINISQYNSN